MESRARPEVAPCPSGEEDAGAREVPGTLHLLPEPAPVRVRTEAGRPCELWDGDGCRELAAVEGPERLSGDWWKDPWRREYFRLCTMDGELLWAYREVRRDGALRWWLHGWWD